MQNRQAIGGYTALIQATTFGRFEVVQALLDARANTEAKDNVSGRCNHRCGYGKAKAG